MQTSCPGHYRLTETFTKYITVLDLEINTET